MSFVKKYNDSINIAEFAYNDNKYDIAVNRYYYGLYQKMLNEIEKNEIDCDINSMNGENSHNKIISLYRDKVLDNKVVGKDKLKIIIKFNREITALKNLRHKADYKSTLVSEKEAKEAKKKFNILNEII